MDYLEERAYPGNVRELLQLVLACLRRYAGAGALTLSCCPEEEVRRWQVAPSSAAQGWHPRYVDAFVCEALRAGVGLKKLGRLVEAAAVRIAVEDADSVTAAAQRLGVTARALHHRRAAEKGGPPH
jgi:transcriptional regulator with GAF, ATPase, and Fis domain